MPSVIVVGGGLAGLSAVLEAAAAGAQVTLIEKEKMAAGNSAKATSGINGAVTIHQIEKGVQDTLDAFKADTLKSGHGLCKEDLVQVLVNGSKEAIEWVSSHGINLSNLSQCGGHSAKRTHREPARADGKPSPVGFDIVQCLKNKVAQLTEEGRVKQIMNTRVADLITEECGDDLAVVGVKMVTEGVEKVLMADAVILATGGYACDFTEDSLLKKHVPQKYNLPTTNGSFATGDGVKMGLRIGAHPILMDQVQAHPTSFVDPKNPCAHVNFLGPEALRGCGGIMVNSHGVRFYSELGRRDEVSNAIFEHCQKLPSAIKEDRCPTVAYLIMNQTACDMFGQANLGFYKAKGLIRPFESVTALAAEIGCPEAALRQTLREYGRVTPDPFGKTVFPVTFDENEPLWLAIITPALHYSMGGLEINTRAQILRQVANETRPIINLYGAGEVTGGVHGGNRLAGNSLLECVVYGRIAGRNAVQAQAA